MATTKDVLKLLAEVDPGEAKRVVQKLVQQYGYEGVCKKYGQKLVHGILNPSK